MGIGSDIDKVRNLFASPAKFLAQAQSFAAADKLTGINFDFEAGNATAADGLAYAGFLSAAASQLSIRTTVDVARCAMVCVCVMV
jgi:hypothetical protein